MIQEDYVSFETAKLLKEKGFDEMVEYAYGITESHPKGDGLLCMGNRNSDNFGCAYSRPTLQMAMKWLREVHKIACQICPSIENGFHTNKWHSYIHKLSDNFPKDPLWFVETTDSYEEAAEAAIKYCLENLI